MNYATIRKVVIHIIYCKEVISTIRVEKREGESIDALYSRFKRAVNNAGVLADVKRREFYLKPGVRRRLERAENRRKRHK
jgi:small subunit ribosomal protein S21